MTDEEMAEKYVDEEVPFDITESGEKLYTEYDLKYAYLAGTEPREKRIEELEKENAELKAQIEKMKCCGNCEYFDSDEPNYCHKGVYRKHQYVCNKWKFLEEIE